MRETLKRLAKLTAGYSLVTLIGPLFTILLTPLYTRVLTPADYGVVDVALTLSSFIVTLCIFSIDQAMANRFHAPSNDDSNYQRRLVTSAVTTVALFGLCTGVFINLSATPIAIFLFGDPYRDTLIRLIGIQILFAPIYAITVMALRMRMGIKRVNALGVELPRHLGWLDCLVCVGA